MSANVIVYDLLWLPGVVDVVTLATRLLQDIGDIFLEVRYDFRSLVSYLE